MRGIPAAGERDAGDSLGEAGAFEDRLRGRGSGEGDPRGEDAESAVSAEKISSLEYAFLGDAVYDVQARLHVLACYRGNLDKMNRAKQRLVCAEAQSEAVRYLLEKGMLSEQEQAVYRRARNHRIESKAKHASVGAYHRATGFEAVVGYLYLKGERERLEALSAMAIRYLEGRQLPTTN